MRWRPRACSPTTSDAVAGETSLQRRIRRALEAEFGGYWYKVWGGPFQPAGLPDLHGDAPVDGVARSVWVEVKDPEDGEISAKQVARMRQLMDAKAAVCVATSPEEAVEFTRQALAGLRFCFTCLVPVRFYRSHAADVSILQCSSCGDEV